MYDAHNNPWEGRIISCPLCGGKKYKVLFKLIKKRCNPQRPADTFVRCISCGFIYINPRILFPKQGISIKLNSSEKENIDSIAKNRLASFELDEDLERIYEYKKSGNLLEIGCGTGAFLSLASRMGFNVTGVEPRKEYAEYGATKYGLDIIQGLVGDPRQCISLEDDKYDVVVLNEVIEHVLDINAFISAVKKCMKVGGLLYLTTPDVHSLYAFLFRVNWDQYHVCWHHHFFNKQTLKYSLNLYGFKVVKTWPTYLGQPIIWRRIIKQILIKLNISLNTIALIAEKQ